MCPPQYEHKCRRFFFFFLLCRAPFFFDALPTFEEGGETVDLAAIHSLFASAPIYDRARPFWACCRLHSFFLRFLASSPPSQKLFLPSTTLFTTSLKDRQKFISKIFFLSVPSYVFSFF